MLLQPHATATQANPMDGWHRAGHEVQGGALRRPHQFPRLRSIFRSRAVQRVSADTLRDISTACFIAAGYLLLFSADNAHAHRLLWVAVLTADAIAARIGSIDLRGE